MRRLRYPMLRQTVALVAIGVVAFALWEWNTARLRQEFIAEIEQRGGKVIVDGGIASYYGSHSGQPPPPPTLWDKIKDAFDQWRKRGRLTRIELPSPLTRRDAERMWLLASVSRVEIREADDEALSALPAFPPLEYLTLHSTAGTDAGLACLNRMPKLYSLQLRGRGFTDATRIVEHPQLKVIDVSETAVSEASLAALVACSRLGSLNADRTGVTGRDLHAIPITQIALYNCSIAGNPLTDQALARLYAAPTLDSFDASDIEHGPAALAALAANRTLTDLTLNDVRTDWKSLIGALASMTQLEQLSLHGAQLKPEHLKRLLRLPKLTLLQLQRSTATRQMYDNAVAELDQEFGDFRHRQVIVELSTRVAQVAVQPGST